MPNKLIVDELAIVRKLNLSKRLRSDTIAQQRKLFQKVRLQLFNDFRSHDISLEIAAGPNLTNSKFVGTDNGGNLFSFIGFPVESNPIEDVIKLMRNINIRFEGTRLTAKTLFYNFKVDNPYPLVVDSPVTALPWEDGISWVEAIEEGISGFGFYLYDATRNFANSRSGPAIQIQKTLREGSYNPRPYFSVIVDKFEKRLKRALGPRRGSGPVAAEFRG